MKVAAGVRFVREHAEPLAARRFWRVPDWWDDYGVVAGVTGNDADYALNGRGEDGRRELLEDLAAGFRDIAVARQVHGAHIVEWADAGRIAVRQPADGHVTAARGLLLGVTVADCVPVYLAHPPSGVVGIVHAGWRGIAAGAVEAGIAAVSRTSGAASRELVMHCGVGICGSCYEVGPEVHAAVRGVRRSAPASLDLRRAAVERAQQAGVGVISVSEWCTAHDLGFHSHRATGGSAGRMLAVVGRPAT